MPENVNLNEQNLDEQPKDDEHQGLPGGWQLVVAIAIGAVVIIVALVITGSAADARTVAIALAIVIAALLSARAFIDKWKG
jgi:hypothetical protein